MKKILSTQKSNRESRSNTSFLGMYIPKELSDYITLYCHVFTVTKTDLLKAILVLWREQESSQTQLEWGLAKKSYQIWCESSEENYDIFKDQFAYELHNAKLNDDVIKRILIFTDNENKESPKDGNC